MIDDNDDDNDINELSLLPWSLTSHLLPKSGHYVFRCWQQLHEDIVDIFVKTAGNGFASMRPCAHREAWAPDVNNNMCMEVVSPIEEGKSTKYLNINRRSKII